MTTKYKLADPLYELGRVLPGDTIEQIKTILEDPGADMSYGELTRFGQAMTDIGARCLDEAKGAVHDRIAGGVGESGRYVSAGVLFEWRPSYEAVRVDTQVAKREFPLDDYPERYKTSTVKSTVSVKFVEA